MKMVRPPSVCMTCPASTLPVLAMLDSKAIMPIARMSSMIRMPNTSWAKRSFLSFSSPSALTMIVVDDTASMAPRNTEFIVPQLKYEPIR